MSEDPTLLEIELGVNDDVSARELDDLTAAMRRELLQLDVEAVDRVSAGPPPDGTRGIDVAAIGALIVNLGKATPVLGQVVEVIQAWAAREPNRTVKLTLGDDTLELGGMTAEQQTLVIRDWMARHPKAAGGKAAAP